MDRKDEVILVVGATGQQGGAAARHLSEDGWRLRALVRDPDKPAARHLSRIGVDLAVGDLLDRASLDAAVADAYGVFCMSTPFEAGTQAEETEAENMADASAAAGVRHFVFDSVAGAGSGTGPDWIVAKSHIEEHIRALGLPYTILRPVTFMENFLRHRDEILAGRLVSALWPESEWQYIAVDDIGRFVALAFREPERFIGKELDIAGDSTMVGEIADTFSSALGIPVTFEHEDVPGMTPPRPSPGEEQPQRADLEACRKLMPGLTTLKQWIEASGWKAMMTRT